MARSDALASRLQERAERLEVLSDRIISCHVVVELEGHHHLHGDRFRFSIHLGVPGHELVVTHAPPTDRDFEHPYASADRAFDEAERQLEDWVRCQRDLRYSRPPSDLVERPSNP